MSMVTRFGLAGLSDGVASKRCMRSFKPDARRTSVEAVGSGGTGTVTPLRGAPFDVGGFAVGFFSSTSRPRVFG